MQGILKPIFVGVVLCGMLVGANAKTPSVNGGPEQLNAALKQADQLIAVERLDAALDLLKTIDAKTARDVAKVDTLLGKVFLRLHKPGKAADYFEHAVLSSMDDAEAYLGLAEAKLALGSLVQARQHASTAIRSDSDVIGAHLVLAKVDERSGRVSEARKRLTSLLQNQPNSEPVIITYAMFLSQRDNINSATDMLSRFVDRHPFAAEAGDLLGQLYWQQGQRTSALQARAIAAKAFRAMGNDFRAEAILSWLVANDPSGEYVGQLKPRKLPKPKKLPEAPQPSAPAPAPVPVPPVERAEVPDIPRPTKTLKRPAPLPLPEGAKLSTGSGFIVDDGRYVITNRHVVQNTGRIAVRNGFGEVRQAKIARSAEKDDLVILELSEAFPESYAIPFEEMTDARTGRAAMVLGYPLASIVGWQQPSLTEGIVSKESGLRDNPTTFQITSKMNKGNSGGPVFDRRGRLIGVAVAKLDTTSVYEKKGHLPEDVNIAVKASRLLNFLKLPANDHTRSTGPEISLEELYQVMLAKVVMVAAVVK
jgi:serine protease Do